MNDETTHHHASSLLVVKWLISIMPHKVKPGTRIQSYIAGKPYDTTLWAATCCMEARASKEAGSLSAPHAMTGGPNRVVVEASPRSNRSR